MVRKSFIFVLSIMLLLVAACSGGGGATTKQGAPSEGASSNDSNGATNGGSEDAVFVMRVGHTLSPESPRHVALLEFEKRVEEASEGALQVELHHSNSVGDNNQLLQAVPLGTIEAAVQPTSFFGGVVNDLSVLDLPFLFRDVEHLQSFASSENSDVILDLLESKGMTGLALWPLGIQVLTSSKPIDSPEALSGQKFRTMGTPVQLELFSSWGTSPQPIALSELYSSLQQGVIDGQSNDIGTIHDTRLYEVQDYMLITNHGAIIDLFYVNKGWFMSLPEEYQTLLKNTARELAAFKTEEELKVIDEKFQVIIDSGEMTIMEPSEEMLTWLMEQTDSVFASFLEKYPDMESIIEVIKKE